MHTKMVSGKEQGSGWMGFLASERIEQIRFFSFSSLGWRERGRRGNEDDRGSEFWSDFGATLGLLWGLPNRHIIFVTVDRLDPKLLRLSI